MRKSLAPDVEKMTRITFIEHDGTSHVVEAANGQSLMLAAKQNNVEGILAECGGECACATCHVYVATEWMAKVGIPGETEADMLDFVSNPSSQSRLACQISVDDSLDGLVVRLPESQL